MSAYNSSSETVLMAYALDTWYEIEIVIYMSLSKYDVIVDGVKKASLYSFYSANTTVKQVEILTEAGDCFIDNMRIEKYASTEPTITAIGSEETL